VYYGQFSYGSFVYLFPYVDNILIAAKHMFKVKRLKSLLGDEFKVKDLGGAKNVLGLVSTLYDAHFRFSAVLAPQSEEEHSMLHVPYSSVVGSCTRPDIPQADNVVSPRKVYWQAVKWILCYLQGATNLWFSL
jgi:hypothetical protein